jgi:hypothetical protein
MLRYGRSPRLSLEFVRRVTHYPISDRHGRQAVSVRRLPLAPAVVDVGQPTPCPSLAHSVPAVECLSRSSLACPVMLVLTRSGPEAEVRTERKPARTGSTVPALKPAAGLWGHSYIRAGTPALPKHVARCPRLASAGRAQRRLFSPSAVAPRPWPLVKPEAHLH